MQVQDCSGGLSLAEYVIQEAKEKCFEINVKALKQFEKEKKTIVNNQLEVINEDYRKKIREKDMERKILNSTIINSARINLMNSRNKVLMKVFNNAQYRVYQKIISDKKFYSELLQKLILEGLIQLMENRVKIRCLKRDEQLVQKQIDGAKSVFLQKLEEDLQITDFSLEVEIDKDNYLIERELKDQSSVHVQNFNEELNDLVKKSEDSKKAFGGIVLTSADTKIVCKNTLDVRCELSYQCNLPILRQKLFPQ